MEHLGGIDELDLNIISYLQEDGRMTFKEIAQNIGVAERTVRLRVANLRESGVLSIVGIVNPIKVGLKLIAAIQVVVDQHQLEACVDGLNKTDEVRFVALTSGEYQILLEVCVRSHEELGEFLVNKLNRITGIQRTNIIMELKILKNQFNFVRSLNQLSE